MRDLTSTQHYTSKAEEMCQNLKKYIPKDALLVEPFVGAGDLLALFPSHSWEKYDLDPKVESDTRDTLLNPLDYSGKWVITNPPYLARNKAKDKTIFDKYDVDDLYKASIISVLDSEGGILIVPTNFFIDERTKVVRELFFKNFEVKEMNAYNQPMFENTTYSVCAFAFQRKENSQTQDILVNIFPENRSIKVSVSASNGWRIAGEYYDNLSLITSRFSRLLEGREIAGFSTNIKLYAIDTRTKRIHLDYDEELFYGKSTDRSYATFISDVPISVENQKELINRFNNELNSFREFYYDLPMTNFRDFGRKRIGFDFAYKLASKILNELEKSSM